MTNHTPGPWEYIPSDEHHGAYVAGPYGGDICDCYTMSNPAALSVRNGGDSKPIPFQHEQMDANARLIAAAPSLLLALAWLLNIEGKNDLEARDEERPLALAAAKSAIEMATKQGD